MLYPIARKFLFRLDPEEAHHRGIAAARFLAGWPWAAELVHNYIARPARLEVRIAGLTFPNPIGLAAGLDKNAEAALAWWAFGFGFMELGTVTPRPQEGKPKPRIFRYVDQQALVNRMGFNNDGADAIAARLAFQKRSGAWPECPVGVSVGKNLTTPAERAADDYEKAAAKFAGHADYLAINVSSPNTAGLRDLQSKAEVLKLVRAVRVAAPGKPVFVKIAPELSGDALAGVLEACGEGGAAGVIATNTLSTKNRPDLEEGGLSGRPLRDLSPRKVEEVRKLVGTSLAVIGCGGVEDVATATRMFNAGADLVQLYTALIYNGPFLPARLTRGLAGRWAR